MTPHGHKAAKNDPLAAVSTVVEANREPYKAIGFTVEGMAEKADKYGAFSYTYEMMGEALKGLRFAPHTLKQLVAGGLAGAIAKTATAPLARLTILFQVNGMQAGASSVELGILGELRRILREEGLRALWKGNGVTIVHRLPYSALNFYSYEHYKRFIVGGADKEKSARPHHRLVAGGCAGITAATVAYPLDLVRTRLASQTTLIYYKGIRHALATIVRDEGLRGLYKGLGATLVGVGPNLAINFSVYESLKKEWLYLAPHASTVAVSLTCGSVAGIISSSATFPLDLVRRRMQLEGAAGAAAKYKGGMLSIFLFILKQDGVRGLYRGIITEYSKVIPGVSIAFCTYEVLKNFFDISTV
eukprot:jgi/Mesvir1/5046/Mv02247-RA.1